MNFFRFIILSILLAPVFFINAQSSEVHIRDLVLTNTEYSVGDTVEGSFSVYNIKNESQSDLYYYISIGSSAGNGVDIKPSLDISEKIGPIYLNESSNKNILFSYELPDSISGDSRVRVILELKDGSVVDSINTPINISGEVENVIIPVFNPKLVIGELEFEAEAGPTVMDNMDKDSLSLSYTLPATKYEQILTPNIKLFSRGNSSDVIYEKTFPEITTSTTEEVVYSIELPVDLDPLIYEGILSITGDGFKIEDIPFKYIIDGDIATIHNINSNKLSIKKGEEFITTIKYSGVPANILNPNERIVLENVKLSIIVEGTNGLLAEYVRDIDFKKDFISIPLTALSNSDELMYKVTLTKDNKTLDIYETKLVYDFSDEKETKETFPSTILYFSIIIVLLIIIFVILFLNRRKEIFVFENNL